VLAALAAIVLLVSEADHVAVQQRTPKTATASSIPAFQRPLSARDLLASVRAFSEGLQRLNERHGTDPEVAAVCDKWACRVADFERDAGALRHAAATKPTTPSRATRDD
jgi:hypothetical protein